MSLEIIYTSAEKGLKPGSRGFCTVVSTAGMAKNLAERLESLSGYRHQFMPHEPGENPVNYSHLRMTVGGKKYHVLSRICDAGLDYTKRTNKLAHHIALRVSEAAKVPGGPAWAMAQSNFLVQKWDGEVKTLPESYRTPTVTPCPVRKCSTWASLKVDPGWAGALAETAIKKSPPTTVIFEGGADTRALVVEALALVPSEKRWDVTFTTYFTKLPAGVDCLWRFVPDETPEATALRRNKHARVIDLCDPSLGMAPASELTELARTGKPVPVEAPEPTTAATPSGRQRRVRPDAPPTKSRPRPEEPSRTIPLETGVDISDPAPSWRTDPRFAEQRGSRWRTMLLVPLSLLFVACMIGAFYYYLVESQAEIAEFSPVDKSMSAVGKTSHAEVGPSPDSAEKILEDNPVDSPPDEARQDFEHDEQQRLEQENKAMPDRVVDPAPPAREEEPAPEAETSPPVERKPFEYILEHNNRLKLPRPPTQGVGSAEILKFEEIAKLYIDSPGDCELKLRGDEVEPRSDREVTIKTIDKDGVRSWEILTRFNSGFGKPTVNGTFQLKDQSLQFRWGKRHNVSLQLCLLDITIGNQTQTCNLNNPEIVPPIQMEFNDRTYRKSLTLKNEMPVRLDVWFTGKGFGDRIDAKPKGIMAGKTTVIRIPNPKGLGKKKFVDIEVTLDSDNRGVQLQAFAYPQFYEKNELGEQGGLRLFDRRTRLSHKYMKDAEKACRDDLKKIPKERFKTNKELEELESLKRELAAKLRDLEKKMRKAKGDLKEILQEQINNLQGTYQPSIDRLNRYKIFLNKSEEITKLNRQWQVDMDSLLERIHNDGRIHFRAYVETAGVQLDLLRTEP